VVRLTVTKMSDLFSKIIPFFQKHPLQGTKKLDFEDFVEVAQIIKIKGHLTAEGLKEIQIIKFRMNRGRK
jgi:hypothetical protein